MKKAMQAHATYEQRWLLSLGGGALRFSIAVKVLLFGLNARLLDGLLLELRSNEVLTKF